MKFVRFGKIPLAKRSVNFLSMTNDEKDSFHFMLMVEPDRAFEQLDESHFENGVSAYHVDDNGMPVLENLQQAASLSSRLYDDMYIITGEEVSKGNDLEPVVSVEECMRVDDVNHKELINLIYKYLCDNFEKVTGERDESSTEIFPFCDFKTNEHYFSFLGFDFYNPKKGFDTTLGLRKER